MTAPMAHRAGWVMATPSNILPNGYVLTAGHQIIEIGQGRPPEGCKVIDHGPGVLMPALVNTHTHLELSALKGRLPLDQGFQVWVEALIELRAALSDDELRQGVADGIAELRISGCAAAGEISSLGMSRDLFRSSALMGVWFHEFLGADVDPSELPNIQPVVDGMAGVAVAGHAPHTTSSVLLTKLKKITRQKESVFSIHIAESGDEIEFLQTGKGKWADFLRSRGIDFSDWGLPYPSPLHYIDQLGLVDEHTILVHLLRASRGAFERIAEKGAWVCLCPRSNQNLHQRLPDVEAMRRAGVKLCLGTDSLASVDSLRLLDEMAFLHRAFPSLPPDMILSMATINGARALGIDRYIGSLEPGKQGRMVYLELEAERDDRLMEMIVNREYEALNTIIER